MGLERKIIRLSFTNPDLREDLEPILRKIGATHETSDFIEWVVNTRQPMGSTEIAQFLENFLGIRVQAPLQKNNGPRFQVGDRIEIFAKKHNDFSTRGVYDEFDGKLGTVVEISNDDVLVKLDTAHTDAPVRFPGGMKPRGAGVYKHTAPYTVEGSHKIEIIYLANGTKPSPDEKFMVNQYTSRAKGSKKRPTNYYTGHITQARYNDREEVYFLAFPQQKINIDPRSESEFLPRAFSASRGKILYIGLADKRPPGWHDELKDIRLQNNDIGLLAELT